MTPALELEDITFLRDGRRVLDGASLRPMPGERLCLHGPNGAGKTTLLRIAIGLSLPQSGRVILAGRSCGSEAEFRHARAGIGFMFQESDDQLFCPTVEEDVAFGPMNRGVRSGEALALARKQLSDLDLAHLALRPVHRLSGGEKRLVCLAGLLVTAPRLLLLDEPTSGLDEEAEARLVRHLRDFDGAMLVVTHDAALPARLSARRADLRAGRLVA